MNCPKIVGLSCAGLGSGYLAKPLCPDDTTLTLMTGHSRNFPTLGEGEFFYLELTDCDKCERVKVVATRAGVFTLERPNPSASAFPSNIQVRYDDRSVEYVQAVAESVHVEYGEGFIYDSCTRTLSFDCSVLGGDCGGCGGGGGGGTGTQGPPGPAGRPGKDGDSVVSSSVSATNVLTFKTAGGQTLAAGTIRTVEGAPGAQGPEGPAGAPGPKGDDGQDAKSITLQQAENGRYEFIVVDDEGNPSSIGAFVPPRGVGVESTKIDTKGDLIIVYTDGQEVNAGHTVGATGPIGPNHSFSYYKESATKNTVIGPAGKQFKVRMMPSGAEQGPFTIPASGIYKSGQFNPGSEDEVYIIFNGQVVAGGKA